MHIYTIFYLNLVTTFPHFCKEYFVIKDEFNIRKFQENMGAGENIQSIEIVYYASPAYTEEIFKDIIPCDLFRIIEKDKETSILVYGFLKNFILYNYEDVVMGPFIRYYSNKKKPKIFCEELIKIDIFDLKNTLKRKISLEDEREECIETLIHRIVHEYIHFNNTIREVGDQLKNVCKNNWYVPVHFSKAINMKSLLRKLKFEEINSEYSIENSFYFLQLYYVTAIYEGGTFDTEPEKVLETILRDEKKKELMMNIIFEILNDMALAHRAMELKRSVIQKSLFLYGSSVNSEVEIKTFCNFVVHNEESFIKKSEKMNVLLFSSDEEAYSPEFWFKNNMVFISKENFYKKLIKKVQIEFETEEGTLITKIFKPIIICNVLVLVNG